ncbi:hypothetical protein AAGS61_05500 [Lysinibacillus sp. KU-BSD001]|uniref:hypothetical protein n=1 Tax=Lysinibacillus sp. KU-BSD001 TaxID=3141328 RepID=UPI0036E13B5F
MTKWKEQIDRELGTEQKFTRALQRKIEAKAGRKRSVNGRYGVVLLGMVAVLALLFIVGPSQSIKWENTTSLEQSNRSIKAFYISILPTEEEKFTARNGWYIGIKRYTSAQDRQFMQRILSEAEPGDAAILSYQNGQDLLVELVSGEQLSLKFYDFSSWVGFKNVTTGEFYILAGEDVATYLADYTPELNVVSFLVVNCILLLLNGLAEKWLKKRYHISGRNIRYANKKHYWVMTAVSVLLPIGIIFFLQNFMLHKGLLLLIIGGILILDLVFVQKYEELEVVKKFSWVRTGITIIVFTIGLSYL